MPMPSIIFFLLCLCQWAIMAPSPLMPGYPLHHLAQHRILRDTSKDDNIVVSKVLQLITEGHKIIQRDSKYKEVVLVVGNTGAGKSTLTNFLAGNLSHLISYEINDEGRFLIKDTGGVKISVVSTVVSKSIFPELVIDPETDTAFYDCPGFSDTRVEQEVEIANAYFIKYVADHADKVKLLLVINHSGLKSGESRTEFPLLVTSVLKLIQNVTKLREGMALVATKVDDTRGDEAIVKGIASFMRQAKADFPQLYGDSKDRLDNAVALVDALLSTDNSTMTPLLYPKLGIFRVPKEAGPLSSITEMVEGKRKLNEVVKGLKFVSKLKDDFGISLTSNAVLVIDRMAQDVDTLVQNATRWVGEGLRDFYVTHKFRMVDDIQLFRNKLSQELKGWMELVEISGSQLHGYQPTDIKTGVERKMNQFEVTLSDDSLAAFSKQEDVLQFLRDTLNSTVKTNPLLWVQPLAPIFLNALQKQIEWYDFLMDAHSRLSSYEVQRQKELYNVANIGEWGQPGKGQGIQLTGENVEAFLTKLDGTFNMSKVHGNILTLYTASGDPTRKLTELTEMTKLTLGSNLTCDFDPTSKSVRVTGYFVLLTQIKKDSTCLVKGTKELTIFAAHTVFLDTDLVGIDVNPVDNLNVVILSPNWSMGGGGRRINLDGKMAPPHPNLRAGIEKGGEGSNGLPGYAGGNGGNFFGVRKVPLDGSLNLVSNGGAGGPGQDGGNGQGGIDGVSVVKDGLETSVWSKFFWPNSWTRIKSTRFTCKDEGETGKSCCNGIASLCFCQDWLCTGLPGSPGKNGGHGGKGGVGGYGGSILLVEAGKPSQVILGVNGPNGVEGKGGPGGAGGVEGVGTKYRFEIVSTRPGKEGEPWMWGYDAEKYQFYAVENVSGTKAAMSGNRGKDNYNGLAQRPSIQRGQLDFQGIFGQFRNFAGEFPTNIFHSHALNYFVEEVGGDTTLNKKS